MSKIRCVSPGAAALHALLPKRKKKGALHWAGTPKLNKRQLRALGNKKR